MRNLRDTIAAVRGDGRKRDTRCPSHDDYRASLGVLPGNEPGKIVLTCSAGCTTETVMAAAGLEWADLFPEKTSTKSRIVAEYRYVDAGGLHLFDVVRLAPKDFRQRRADGTWKMDGVRRVLYHLPELQGASVVYKVEGEKDVDRLRSCGVRATCNPGGAGKWKPEYTQQLKAAAVEHVVVLPDNDDPGRAHAAQVAASCHAAGLKVKIVHLPDLPAKGDISDWLDAGHTRDELVALVKATPLYDPQVASACHLPKPVITFLHTVEPEPVDWIWPGRLARGKYTLIPGEPGIGKTNLFIDAAARITRGGQWPDGSPAPRGRVLFLTAEDGIADTIRPRLDVMGGDPSRMAVLEAIREPDGSRRTLSLVRDLDMLAQAIREVDPVLVGIDPLSAYLGQVDTHRDGEVRSALAPLLALIAERRCALAAIAHLSKDAQRAALHRPGGSIAFVAAARLVLAVAADPNDPERRLLAPLKGNLGKPAPVLAYRITDRGALAWEAAPVTGTDVEVLFRPTSPGDLEERTDAETVIRELIAETAIWPIDAKEAIAFGQGHGIHERTLQRAARRLGLRVERQGFGRGGRWFWHRPPIDDIPDTISPEHPDVSSMAPMEKPSEIDVNNNIDDTKSAFARAREAGAITDADGIF